MSHQSWSSGKQRQSPLAAVPSSVASSLAAAASFVLLAAVASASPIAAPRDVELLHEPALSSPAAGGAEVAERAALALREVDALCDGDPDCEEAVVNEEADELLLEPRPGRGGSGSYYFRTRKDGLEDKRSRGYLFRTRKSAGFGQQVRNRKGGYLFRTRKDLTNSGDTNKRGDYLFRTRRTPYGYQAKRQQGSYLFRTRKSSGYNDGFGSSSYENSPRLRRGQSYLFRT